MKGMKLPSKDALEKFESLSAGVNSTQVFKILWNRYLSDADRERILIDTETRQSSDGLEFIQVSKFFGNASVMWKLLRGVSSNRAYLDVALLVDLITQADYNWLLRAFEEIPLNAQAAKDEAIMRGDLVLVRSPATLHWSGNQVEIDWSKHRVSWKFFLTACEHAKRSEAIDQWSFSETARENFVSQAKSRLKSTRGFPPKIIEAFKSEGTGSQRLDFPPELIHIFDQ
jgi:hypothetical protein